MQLETKKPWIILIAGKARSGKNTVAESLQQAFTTEQKKVIMSPYTKYLKQYIELITGDKITDTSKPRDLLQKISSELIKGKLSKKDFFIRRQVEDIEILSYFADVIIVPDVRFPSEIEVIKQKFPNVISIGVTRVEYTSDLTLEQQQDITEIALDNYNNYDYKIINQNKNKLHQDTLTIYQKIKEEGKL